jgi:hypothetical protein
VTPDDSMCTSCNGKSITLIALPLLPTELVACRFISQVSNFQHSVGDHLFHTAP